MIRKMQTADIDETAGIRTILQVFLSGKKRRTGGSERVFWIG
ncbi:hypothetical protein [[Ruminococcus] torques]|nr:hypothetical protein [[Ruminococcus] torques]MDM8235519.1 hypothetical protein [[Ruminococcus] torques]